MKSIIKWFLLFAYWGISIDFIQQLVNYPDDLALYGGILWLILNIYLTTYLIKNNKLK